MNGNILVVDDDIAVGKVLVGLLMQAGHRAAHVGSGAQALLELDARPYDVVVSDIRMPGVDGLALLDAIQKRWPELPVVLLTAHATVATAVEALRRGAADFLTKPFDRDEVLFVISKCLQRAEQTSRDAPAPNSTAEGLWGDAPAMVELRALIARIAPAQSTVLIRGESGTGKELAARAIHQSSPRASKPYVRINCGALPDTLLESELFGYEKGAFTGANVRKPGRVELADGGTLFLDEIGDVTPAMQVKLLRLLQEREFERLGSNETRRVDVRFIAATHQPLEKKVSDGSFREDLFWRLNVVPIVLPPLRERGTDIGRLAQRFAQLHGAANGKPLAKFSEEALRLLEQQPWPGNVRQLTNFAERLVVMNDTDRFDAHVVSNELARMPFVGLGGAVSPVPAAAASLDGARQDAERAALNDAIRRCQGNRTAAARLLGISRRTLYNKMETLGLIAADATSATP